MLGDIEFLMTEDFEAFAEAIKGIKSQKADKTAAIKDLLQEFTSIPADDPKMYEDLGAEGVEFKMEMGKGECAA